MFSIAFKNFLEKGLFLQVLKPQPRGHPFPVVTFPLKKDDFSSCLLKLKELENLN